MSSPEIKAVAALDDDLRWRMYTFIRAERRPVTRDEAAASVGISRKLAAFHLDKLVDAGLLRAGYQAAGKVGRAPKVYEPTNVDIRVAIPQRQHDVLAEILLDTVLAQDVSDAAVLAAAQRGEKLGTQERDKAKLGRLGPERALTVAQDVLARHGFEPARESPTCVRLRNCPFHPLAAKAPDLVCGINQAFLNGLLGGLQAPAVRAVLVAPRPGECCVLLRGTDAEGRS
ncbi:transcriptional regulator [Actinosynnema sp. ALI-1.44]|uniref:helix-turn-helix transcriptional regulator n=1 Tax=Actinosynnema sp. ALI-1.44 TaxID=1933779 RepID=UPI00097BE9B5|nr:transcriptional regulator [Actinosynnema sp. ALI-1.44]ONI79263.1 transcriptional regulator [Actinosynnema sp. ALI-1.44]